MRRGIDLQSDSISLNRDAPCSGGIKLITLIAHARRARSINRAGRYTAYRHRVRHIPNITGACTIDIGWVGIARIGIIITRIGIAGRAVNEKTCGSSPRLSKVVGIPIQMAFDLDRGAFGRRIRYGAGSPVFKIIISAWPDGMKMTARIVRYYSPVLMFRNTHRVIG